MGAPLALQWLRLVLPMQGAGIQFLVKKLQSHIPHGITKKIKIKKKIALTTGTSLAVWWLRLWASTIGGTGSIPVQTKKKMKKKKKKERSMTFRAGSHFKYFYSQLIFVHPSTEDFYRQSILYCGSFCFKILPPKEREGKGVFTSWSVIRSRKHSGQALTLN